jgi:hypothetical protein
MCSSTNFQPQLQTGVSDLTHVSAALLCPLYNLQRQIGVVEFASMPLEEIVTLLTAFARLRFLVENSV